MLSKRLRELRKKKGLTQGQLGNIVGLSQQTIGHYEVNRAHPDYDTLKIIADYFGVSVDYLLGRTDNRSQLLYASPPQELDEIFERQIMYKGKLLTEEEKENIKEFIELALKTIMKKKEEY